MKHWNSACLHQGTSCAAIWRISMNECPLTIFHISHSDESGKQSLYPDGDPDRHQNFSVVTVSKTDTET